MDWVEAAGDERLQREDDLGGNRYWIFAEVGVGAM